MDLNTEFLDNIEFFIMCRNLIEGNHNLGGCVVKQAGFTTATLGVYLDFWFNCLPASTDALCRPICAISDKACYVCNEDHELVKAKLNVPIDVVVETFRKCIERNKQANGNQSLSKTISNLRESIANQSIDPTDLIGWQQYYMPARISVLEQQKQNTESPDLTPRPDNPIAQKLHQERIKYEATIQELHRELRDAFNKLYQTRKRLKEELIKSHQKEYEVFYNKLMDLKTIELMLSQEYSVYKYNLLKELRADKIDISTYRKRLFQSRTKSDQAREDVENFFRTEIEKIFGPDKTLFDLYHLDS